MLKKESLKKYKQEDYNIYRHFGCFLIATEKYSINVDLKKLLQHLMAFKMLFHCNPGTTSSGKVDYLGGTGLNM